jgi:hypothetical protein
VAPKFPLSVKILGDFEDVLAPDNPAVWQSHRPAAGGEAGEMLQRIIERAAKLKAGGPRKKAAARSKPRKTAAPSKAKRPARRRAKA